MKRILLRFYSSIFGILLITVLFIISIIFFIIFDNLTSIIGIIFYILATVVCLVGMIVEMITKS